MEQVYIFTLSALFLLATFDLVVGVSNDAVNFLNSAFSSKAARLRTIMIVASIGVGIGAIFSNGMMEIAKKGIFNPEMFYFEEVMVIFAAVMLADIVLLDFFNNIGLPTSTTISIVFELRSLRRGGFCQGTQGKRSSTTCDRWGYGVYQYGQGRTGYFGYLRLSVYCLCSGVFCTVYHSYHLYFQF